MLIVRYKIYHSQRTEIMEKLYYHYLILNEMLKALNKNMPISDTCTYQFYGHLYGNVHAKLWSLM